MQVFASDARPVAFFLSRNSPYRDIAAMMILLQWPTVGISNVSESVVCLYMCVYSMVISRTPTKIGPCKLTLLK